MGGCGSKVAPPEDTSVEVKTEDMGEIKIGEKVVVKSSQLLYPASAKGPLPGIVIVHGMCGEGFWSEKVIDMLALLNGVGRTLDNTWTGQSNLAKALAQQGVAVLMIGLPDNDEQVYDESNLSSLLNAWPAKDYSVSLSASVDLLVEQQICKVDAARVGLVGHSMGGAGVLFAAARECKGKVAAVAALNPGHLSIMEPNDVIQGPEKYYSGAKHSGEFGEGDLPHLKEVGVPTLVYGSQAEMNTALFSNVPIAAMWPSPPSVYEQLGSEVKELYVDNLTDQTNAHAHVWMCTPRLPAHPLPPDASCPCPFPVPCT